MCSNRDERFACAAKYEAERSELPMKHGCIAVQSGKIIARGYNSYRTASKDGMIIDSYTCHAEIDVLRKCIRQNITRKINVYIVRTSGNGEYRNAAPCAACVNMLRRFKVHNIIYSTNDGKLQKCKLDNYNHHFISSGSKAMISNRIGQKHSGNCFIYKDLSI